MFVFFRTLIYATAFLGLLVVYLPSRLLRWSGIGQPETIGWGEIAGIAIGSIGAVIALLCVGAFIGLGKGTPAPFDPPRRLVVRGPYRFVRNPMYVGGLLLMAGIAIFYRSFWVALYSVAFLAAANGFVIFYEEPTLRKSFGAKYEAYCRHVHRWWPGKAR